MPEGDTIFRAAQTLRSAIAGAEVTDVTTVVGQIRALGPRRLVGQRVAAVEARGKHLLIWFTPSDLALHTHMRMTGSWHLYRAGERWRKPERMVRIALHTANWAAVCFSAPVCELLTRDQVERHPTIAALGPDALAETTDLDEAARRLRERAGWTVAEALLDQRVLAGVGNVYKCEVLFLHGLDPWTPVSDLDPVLQRRLLESCEQLLKANVAAGAVRRTTTRDPRQAPLAGDRLWVYGRARRPCKRCATPIRVARQGEQARLTYWCPRCQGPGAPPGPGRSSGPEGVDRPRPGAAW
jgi:endonuclease VIII